MTDYRVADGWNVVLGSLTVLDPQPMSTGMQPSRRTYAASGNVAEEAHFIEFLWTMVETPTQYIAILTDFGLQGLPPTYTNDVTVYLRNDLFSYQRYNGTAVRPEIGRDVKWADYFPRDVVILVKGLVLPT